MHNITSAPRLPREGSLAHSRLADWRHAMVLSLTTDMRHVSLLAALLFGLSLATGACTPEHTSSCGDGTCDSAENPINCAMDCPTQCGDGYCSGPSEDAQACPEDCYVACAPLDDITALLSSGESFFGYPLLGLPTTSTCSGLPGGRTLYLTFTSDFTGDLLITTDHPSTTVPVALEVMEGTCDTAILACEPPPSTGYTTLSVPVTAGTTYVVAVTLPAQEGALFALRLLPPGVCTGEGLVTNITSTWQTGLQYSVDTSLSTATLSASCGGAAGPEARFTFAAPREGTVVATTAHPETAVGTFLYAARERGLGSCGTLSEELACAQGAASASEGATVSVEVSEGVSYDLILDSTGSGGEAVMTIGYLAPSPYVDSLRGCSHTTIMDRYALFVHAGELIHAAVDTLSLQTAADTRLMIRYPDGAELYEADDEVACTFPPPSYSCPAHSFTATETGLYLFEVYVGSSEICANRSLADYEITVTVNDVDADLIHFGDR